MRFVPPRKIHEPGAGHCLHAGRPIFPSTGQGLSYLYRWHVMSSCSFYLILPRHQEHQGAWWECQQCHGEMNMRWIPHSCSVNLPRYPHFHDPSESIRIHPNRSCSFMISAKPIYNLAQHVISFSFKESIFVDVPFLLFPMACTGRWWVYDLGLRWRVRKPRGKMLIKRDH